MAALLVLFLLAGCADREPEPYFPDIPPHILEEIEAMNRPTPTVWTDLVFPTPQQHLLDPEAPDAFQPTAAGTRQSALYGSVRTANRGGRLRASFHEGIDIAPTARDRRGRPKDIVVAVAEGTVAHVNRHAGNSTYGIYVVLSHPDPIGEIYTLYSHLADVRVRQGQPVNPGTPLGLMGNTATYNIPMSRAHLHFEVGVVLNQHFEAWFRAQGLRPSHGTYHGWNLLGVDPLAFLLQQNENPYLCFDQVLDQTPPAFTWVVRTARLPDYFARYPSRWRDEPYRGTEMTVAFCENGIPLHGRRATDGEARKITTGQAAVLSVQTDVLGRNGRRLVIRRNDGWSLGQEGQKHLDMFLFHPR